MAVKPKHSVSGYMIWLNSARQSIKKENPEFKVTEIAKKGGEIWRNMKAKTEWEAKTAVAKKQYEVAVEDFKSNGGDMSAPTNQRRKTAAKEVPAKKRKMGVGNKTTADSEEESG